MKSYMAFQDVKSALGEWENLSANSIPIDTVLQIAALFCAELQFDGSWEQSIALADTVLCAQEENRISRWRCDEFLYRKALGQSRLNLAEASIVTAKAAMDAGYPQTEYGQRAAVLYCQRTLFASPHYAEAKEILTTVIQFASSEEAFYDAQYALPTCEFGLRNFSESARLIEENLSRLSQKQTRWKQQLYLDRFHNSKKFIDQFQDRMQVLEKRQADRDDVSHSQEVGR